MAAREEVFVAQDDGVRAAKGLGAVPAAKRAADGADAPRQCRVGREERQHTAAGDRAKEEQHPEPRERGVRARGEQQRQKERQRQQQRGIDGEKALREIAAGELLHKIGNIAGVAAQPVAGARETGCGEDAHRTVKGADGAQRVEAGDLLIDGGAEHHRQKQLRDRTVGRAAGDHAGDGVDQRQRDGGRRQGEKTGVQR